MEKRSMKELHAAARIIQRAWRRFVDIQVFTYYKGLVNFRGRGDPSAILRCINPTEAKLIDSAAGVFIKFRLIGEKFPPNVCYKLFTHRPVVDICEFAPRDYTLHKWKAARQHNNRTPVVKVNNKSRNGWYERFENNGWRLVSERVLASKVGTPGLVRLVSRIDTLALASGRTGASPTRTGSHSPLRPSAATTFGATLPSANANARSAAATTTSAGERPDSAQEVKAGTHAVKINDSASGKSANESSYPLTKRDGIESKITTREDKKVKEKRKRVALLRKLYAEGRVVEGPECPGEPRSQSATSPHQEHSASPFSSDLMRTRDRWMARVPSALAGRAGVGAEGLRAAPAAIRVSDSSISSVPPTGVLLHPTEVSHVSTQLTVSSSGEFTDQMLLQGDDGLRRGTGVLTGESDDTNEDVDALLRWTQLLDFDRYVSDWHILGTTAPSDAFGPIWNGFHFEETPFILEVDSTK